MEETKVRDTNIKTQLSLAAALFFSPLVQNILNKYTRDITDQDKLFIYGYIKFGYITLLFGFISIAAWIMNYLLSINILHVIYIISIGILFLLLFVSVISILSDISLVKWWDYSIHTYTTEWVKKDIILQYLPIYNVYLRYILHNFDKPNWRIKESLLLWMAFLITCILGNVFVSSSILLLIILRIASLMSDIDIISPKVKQRLNGLFSKNPEEIRWYFTGMLLFIGKSLIHIFIPLQTYTLWDEIAKEKEMYSYIINIQTNKNIIIEYILWFLLMVWFIYMNPITSSGRIYYTWFGLYITRYLVMWIQLKHLPHLPIAREIVFSIKNIIELFKRKPFIPNK